LAAYDPSLLVGDTNPALGQGGPVRIFLQVRDQDDATGMVTLYAPRGYGVSLGQPAGAELGSVIAFVRTGPISDARQAVQGVVRADDPANHATNTCAPGNHDAVWLIDFTLTGRRSVLPIYVDRVEAGPEAAYASVRMRMCPVSPYTPAAQGVSLTYADLTIEGVFTNPAEQGTYAWNALFVPYARGTGTLNIAEAAQSTAYVPLPARFAVTAKRQAHGKKRFAIVTACLTEAGQGLRGVRVTLYYGGKTVFGSRKVATPSTNGRGCVTARIPLKRTNLVFASARVPIRGASGCTPTLAVRCSSSSIYPPSVRFRAVRITT
jgi:hypothetical protein